MKKLVIIIIALAIITGCAGENMKNSLTDVNNNIVVESPKETEQEQEETVKIRPVEESSTNDDITIINYVNNLETEVESLTNDEILLQSTKDNLKKSFITLTDFIFYNGTINGITFNELSESVQERVLEIYTNIDKKIESYYPNYKETIKTTSQNIYTNVIEQANALKEKYKEKVGETSYNDTIETIEDDIDRLKDSLSPTLDNVKEKSINTYEELKEQADTWYQNFKESSE